MSAFSPRWGSLSDMLNVSAKPFLGAAAELRSLSVLAGNLPDKSQQIGDGDRNLLEGHLERLSEAIKAVGAKLAQKSVDRLSAHLATGEPITYAEVLPVLQDIEGRFNDYLEDVTMYVIADHETKWLAESDELIGLDITFAFPSTIFEFEEAAKCIALGRHTASAFHSMRVLEVGIQVVGKELEIDDPITAASRNWGVMLKLISDKIDEKWPKKSRKSGSDGAFFEGIHASLDAVRNPWRNATMHVETIYAPHEAEHIFNCVKFFMAKLSERCEEEYVS